MSLGLIGMTVGVWGSSKKSDPELFRTYGFIDWRKMWDSLVPHLRELIQSIWRTNVGLGPSFQLWFITAVG